MEFGSECSILNGLVIYIEKSKLNVTDMWLIPLDRVTYGYFDFRGGHSPWKVVRVCPVVKNLFSRLSCVF